MTEIAELVSQIVQRHREALIEAGASSNTNKLRLAVHAVGMDISRALQDERDGGWQDIATAPKDGTRVDLWCIDHLHYAKQGQRVVNVAWGPVRDWMGTERDDWQHGHGEDFQPTHWRPLPSPPHTFTPSQITENLNERHEAGERA